MSVVAARERAAALQRAIRLEQVSILWMLVEGGVAVASGIAAHSIALVAFGWDSLIEVVTAGVVLWRVLTEFRIQGSSRQEDRIAAAERLSARVVAAGLLALAVYILLEAVQDLERRHVASPGFWGLAVSAVAVVGMPVLYRAKRRVADLLTSESLLEDATGNLACGLMAAIVLAGLVVQRWGWWWADPVAALILGLLVAHEGWEAWGRARERPPSGAVRVYLGLGSNLGDRAATLARARALLDGPDLRIVAVSKVYETLPWGIVDQPRFLNQVIEARTTLSPREVLKRCHDVEAHLGRVRSARWGPRTIDVDILLYGTLRVSEPDLTIPHPQLAHRAFALVPLADLDVGLPVPGGDTVRALLDALPDRGDLREYREDPEVSAEDPEAPAGADSPPAARNP